jgi:ComF family protein
MIGPSFGRRVAGFVFASDCLLCGEELLDTSPVCASCLDRLRPEPFRPCRICANEISPSVVEDLCLRCKGKSAAYSDLRVASFYSDEIKTLIHAFKFGSRWSVCRVLAELAAMTVPAEYFRCDVVIPIPLHRSRLKERGYNQAGLLAECVARKFGCKVDERCLVRSRATKAQALLDHNEREANVARAFHLTRHADRLHGKSVLLVDDVVTTGRTIQAAASELARSGAKEIRVFAAAHAR